MTQLDHFKAGDGGVITTTAETVVATSVPISSPVQNVLYSILFAGFLSVGTGTTAITLNIRRSTVAGVSVGVQNNVNVVAGNIVPVVIATVDSGLAGDLASISWVLTISQTGATGNGTAANFYSDVIAGD